VVSALDVAETVMLLFLTHQRSVVNAMVLVE